MAVMCQLRKETTDLITLSFVLAGRSVRGFVQQIQEVCSKYSHGSLHGTRTLQSPRGVISVRKYLL